jgi:hypothetical protein
MFAILELVATLLSTLGNSAAASTFLSPHVDSILSATSALVRQGEAAIPLLTALTGHVGDMVATGTANGSPTDKQVATLYQHLATATAPVAPAGT